MSTPFPHTCTIIRPPATDSRTIDDESGQPIGDDHPGLKVYSGRCFLDEGAEAVRRERGGDTNVRGDAVLRLPARAAVFDQDQDAVTVEANGVTRTARITKTSYLRRRVHLLLSYDARATSAW